MRVIVDRFEEHTAIVELPDRKTIQIPRVLLDPDVVEGDVIDILVNTEATRKRKTNAENLIEQLIKNSPPFEG